MKRKAASVATTFTPWPASRRRRITPGALYAAMPPVTPTSTLANVLLLSQRFVYGDKKPWQRLRYQLLTTACSLCAPVSILAWAVVPFDGLALKVYDPDLRYTGTGVTWQLDVPVVLERRVRDFYGDEHLLGAGCGSPCSLMVIGVCTLTA